MISIRALNRRYNWFPDSSLIDVVEHPLSPSIGRITNSVHIGPTVSPSGRTELNMWAANMNFHSIIGFGRYTQVWKIKIRFHRVFRDGSASRYDFYPINFDRDPSTAKFVGVVLA